MAETQTEVKTPIPNPEDIILVKNIDVDCNDITTDVVRTSRKIFNPETGATSTVFEDQVEEWSHKDYFQVRWSGHPHRIKPGETRRMPRYIADHFAKYLADHILAKREKAEKRTGLVQSIVERPKVLAQILLKVDEYYLRDSFSDEGARAVAEVEALNPAEEVSAISVGVVPPPAVGVLKPEPPSLDEVMKKAGEEASESLPEATKITGSPAAHIKGSTQKKTATTAGSSKTSLFDKDKPLPSKTELLRTAYEMGLDVTGDETQEQLAAMLKGF